MNFLRLLKDRNLLAQVTHPEELEEHLKQPRTAYLGIDPTADCLTAGHLMGVLMMRRWQQCGHRIVVLMGGGTGIVGDPSGKSDLRQMLTEEDIANNIQKQKKILERFIDFSDEKKAIVVNNADWLTKLSYLPFLRDIGIHFSVNRMLSAECFKQRMEKGLTFLEFNYMLLQSYDFLELFRKEKVTIQLGGDDQWSNMLGGMELVRRVERSQAFCITFPLLLTSEGKKMGKSENGAIWLTDERTPVFDFFQYWRNVDDADVKKIFYYMTDVSPKEIEEVCAGEGAALNQAKERLAFEVTKIVHGAEKAEIALQTAKDLFAGKGTGTGSEPEVFVDEETFGQGMEVAEMLTVAGVFPSKAEAKRFITQGGLTLNGEKVETIAHKVDRSIFKDGEGCLVKKGKKHFYRLRLKNL